MECNIVIEIFSLMTKNLFKTQKISKNRIKNLYYSTDDGKQNAAEISLKLAF